MGLCVVPPAILMVVVSMVLNKVKGIDHKLVELHGLEAPEKREIRHEFAK